MTVVNVITDDDIAIGDVVSTQLEKMWGWYLVGGILSMIFGMFVISYRHASVYAIIYLASGFFIAVGLFEIIGAVRMARQRWLHLIFGVDLDRRRCRRFRLAAHHDLHRRRPHRMGLPGAGHLRHHRFDPHHYLPYWWVYLIRGIIVVAIGFLCIRHPGAPLTALVVLIGIGAILFGAVEVIGAFSARHATKHWEAYKAQLR